VADSRQRLFIGIALHDATRAAIERALQASAAALPKGTRLLAPDNWHLTLQFLGSVSDELAPSVRAACHDTAARSAAFEIELGQVGAFKSPRSARVVWIGLARGAEQLAALYETLTVHTEPLGYTREARPFAAHLSVARIKTPADVRPLLASMRMPVLHMPVSHITLFRSHLSPRGARYEALEHYALEG
jgi:2'-5' RNA ligase